MFKSFTGFVRTIAMIGFAIIAVIILSSFAPDLFWGLVGIIGMLIGWSAPVVFILLFVKSWRLSKKIGMRGLKPRARFMVLRALQDVFHGTYIRMVHGDDDTKPELTKAQRLKLMWHDRSITEQQLKDGLAALRPAMRRTEDETETSPTARPAPRQQHQAVREVPDTTTSRTAPKANRLAQESRTAPRQPQTAPVKELHYEDVPVEDTEVREDETVEFETPAPAPKPQQRPAPQPAAPRSTGVNNSSGFGGSIRITGDWGQPKN